MQGDTVRPKTIVCFEWIIFGTLLLGAIQTSYRLPGALRSVWFRAIAYGAIALGVPQDRNLVVAIFIFLILICVLVVTLTLLVSRRRSEIAMWVSIAIFALGLLPMFVLTINRGELLQSIGQGVAYALLFTPSARRWMRREDKLADVFH